MANSELVDAVSKIIQPELFVDYRHAGPLDEIEKLLSARDAFIETTRAKAREIIALITE